MGNRTEDLVLRISEAMDHLDQANTIFSFVFFALGEFSGTGDQKWDHKLTAMVNVSNIATEPWELDSEAISVASREIVLHRLPRLLVVALVSAIET